MFERLFRGKWPHPSKKKLCYFRSPNLCDYFLWLSWLQNNSEQLLPPGVFWREKPSETEREALAHGEEVDLSIHTLQYTWILQGNKKTRGAFLHWNFPFSAGSWRQVLQCLTGLAVPPFRAVLAGRDQAPVERQTAVGEVMRSHTMPTPRYSSLFYIIPSFSILHHPIISKLRRVGEMPVVWLEQLKECPNTPLIWLWDEMSNNSTKYNIKKKNLCCSDRTKLII